MSPIQQLFLGQGAVATKTYVDDIFSTFLYTGTSSARSINNGIDLAGEGGMVWTKSRSHGLDHYLGSPALGTNKVLRTNTSGSLDSGYSSNFTAFNNNGFSLGSDGITNSNNYTYSSWSFRKAKGFFDVVTYTGNGNTPQAIAHNLGSMPGMVIVKKTSGSGDWMVWHRDLGASSRLELNAPNASGSGVWGSTEPTSTHFYVAGSAATGANGATYVAYLFAGGESTAATARSVDFDGSNDNLSIADSPDWALGQTFTIEFWIYPDNNSHYGGIVSQTNMSSSGWYIYLNQTKVDFHDYNGNQCLGVSNSIKAGQWTHCALVNNSGTAQWYINGTPNGSPSTVNIGNYSLNLEIGDTDSSNYFNGKISNLRVVKGTAVYTSSFRPPTEPLTNITNTKLLCCNNSSVTGSTVAPGTISSGGSPTASTDSPFDDPAAHVFGESESESVIKTGSYVGGSAGLEVNVGFEPQFLLIKNSTSGSTNWLMVDTMRGIVTGGSDERLYANESSAESAYDWVDVTSTGFKLPTVTTSVNASSTYIYVAIRRPDGYVGKPRTATELFAMDTGNGNSSIPVFDSGFPVDLALYRQPGTSENWWTATRLTGTDYLATNTNDAKGTGVENTWDSNVGWGKQGFNNSYQSWMWKRHAGFDVVNYKGTQTVRQIRHSLNKPVEMMWIKNRDRSYSWYVYHKGLNGGSNPEQKYIRLNDTYGEVTSSSYWNDTAPTSSAFTLGTGAAANETGDDFIAMLFASVSGISSVGSFTGNGTSGSSTQTISTGFAPRFLIIKNTTDANSWFVADTVRGWASGDDQLLMLDSNSGQLAIDWGVPTSSGFTLTGDNTGFNANNKKY